MAYDATGAGDRIGAGASRAPTHFTLPDGALGAGTLTVSITTDSNNEVVEGFSGTAPGDQQHDLGLASPRSCGPTPTSS